MVLFVIVLVLTVVLTILFGIYLILAKYHKHLAEILSLQSSLLRTLTNLAAAKDIQGFAALQNLSTENQEVIPQQISRFDPALITEEMADKLLGRITPAEETMQFADEFGGLG